MSASVGPVECVQCQGIAIVLSQAVDPRTGIYRWRYTCLDCRVAWWQDDHGGYSDEYVERWP
ncbi:hypothetical protein ACWGJ2_17645 [Streptomyces sp. NPDC054796]